MIRTNISAKLSAIVMSSACAAVVLLFGACGMVIGLKDKEDPLPPLDTLMDREEDLTVDPDGPDSDADVPADRLDGDPVPDPTDIVELEEVETVDPGSAVWVSTDGDDSASGTLDDPLRTVNAGISAAAADPEKTHVHLMQGSYDEDVALQSGVMVMGGFDESGGHTALASLTVLHSPRGVGVRAEGVSQAGLSWLTVDVSGNLDGSVYGALLISSEDIVLDHIVIRVADGSRGEDGSAGLAGEDGDPGGSGTDGCLEIDPVCVRPEGGTGGVSACAMAGGDGGIPGAAALDQEMGLPGVNGTGGVPPDGGGGTGGAGGPGTRVGGDPGEPGQDGGDGLEGPSGIAGAGFGEALAAGYVPSDGQAGENGGHGGGGGGGGGGDANNPAGTNSDFFGGSGGGGGGGGCGGTAAGGGAGGGGSFGIYVFGGSVDAEYCEITTGSGGTGGNAPAAGGRAGAGGTGGIGGSGYTDALGSSGNGGDGGNGGSGGAGGGGGPSVGILCAAGCSINDNGNSFVTGTGGDGGTGASLGEDGISSNVFSP
jgi:hypothetical protein